MSLVVMFLGRLVELAEVVLVGAFEVASVCSVMVPGSRRSSAVMIRRVPGSSRP